MNPYFAEGNPGPRREHGHQRPGCGCGQGQGQERMRRPEFFGMPPIFGFGGPRGAGRPGRGMRAGRGDVKLGILTLLAESPRHGYEIIQELSARSNGMWVPSPGSVYPTLQALEDESLVSSETIDGKRVYRLAEKGEEYLRLNARATPPWEEIRGDEGSSFNAFRNEAFKFGAAVMQVVQSGSSDQIDRAMKILRDSRKALYLILAQDDNPEAE